VSREFHLLFLVPPLYGDDNTRGDKFISHFYGLIQKSPGVVPKINDQSLKGSFTENVQFLDGLLEIRGCL
jgi:hypothetical protein